VQEGMHKRFCLAERRQSDGWYTINQSINQSNNQSINHLFAHDTSSNEGFSTQLINWLIH